MHRSCTNHAQLMQRSCTDHAQNMHETCTTSKSMCSMSCDLCYPKPHFQAQNYNKTTQTYNKSYQKLGVGVVYTSKILYKNFSFLKTLSPPYPTLPFYPTILYTLLLHSSITITFYFFQRKVYIYIKKKHLKAS